MWAQWKSAAKEMQASTVFCSFWNTRTTALLNNSGNKLFHVGNYILNQLLSVLTTKCVIVQ